MSMLTDSRKALFGKETHKDWQVPWWFYHKYDLKHHFKYDMAATAQNTMCENYFTEEDDSLSIDWPGDTSIWCNPPYNSRTLSKWFERGWDAAKRNSVVVFLVHARTDTKWFHEWGVRGIPNFVKGRLHFLYDGLYTKYPAPFPSLVITYERRHTYWDGIAGPSVPTVNGKKSDHIIRIPRPVQRFPRGVIY